jgi:ribosomal protein S18 acetylase RimI-like enzyme
MNTERVEIRRAVPDDAGVMKDIGVRGWETTYTAFIKPENRRLYLNGDFWSIERLRSVLSDPSAINLAAGRGGQMIGFITTERLDDGQYEVTRLYVDPEVRSHGVGSRMLTSVFEELRTLGVDEVLVNVFGDNHAGRRFYERHGFELTEDTFDTIGDQVLSDVWYAVSLGGESR